MTHREHLSQSVKSLNKQTKAYFHGDQWKEVLVFSFFVLLAFGFWLLQSLQQEYEIILTFPVQYKELPADSAFDKEIPQQVIAKVKQRISQFEISARLLFYILPLVKILRKNQRIIEQHMRHGRIFLVSDNWLKCQHITGFSVPEKVFCR